MDGLLVIDKPDGLTSHDVVAAVRRALRERRVGHTGTLDPLATGVLPLVLGRATRLAKFLSGRDKTYDATIRLGTATDTADAAGAPVGEARSGPWPSREEIDRALDAFRGTFLQQPPAYSAKKIAGRRSYALARSAAATVPGPTSVPSPTSVPRPVAVTVRRLALVAAEDSIVHLEVECSAGFYVRALAHDLGERLGIGAHLLALRRTRSGDYSLSDATTLDEVVREPAAAARRLVPLACMLSSMPSVVLTEEGVRLAAHGRDIGPPAIAQSLVPIPGESLILDPQSQSAEAVRLLSPSGELVAIAVRAASLGVLHPSVVLV
jgi:tRNA pseudouridine55 synthase